MQFLIVDITLLHNFSLGGYMLDWREEFSKVKLAVIIPAFVSSFLAWAICIPR